MPEPITSKQLEELRAIATAARDLEDAKLFTATEVLSLIARIDLLRNPRYADAEKW